MAAYSTLGGNIDKIQEVISTLEKEKGNWTNVIYTDSSVKNTVLNKLDDVITDLKAFKTTCENNGSQMNSNAKWDK